MTNGMTRHDLSKNDPNHIENFFAFEIDPLDYIKSRNLFEELKKKRAEGIDHSDAILAKEAGAKIISATVYGANAWVTTRALRYASVVGCAIRGIEREWTLRHDGDPDRILQTDGMLIVDESTSRQPHFRHVLAMPPPSKKGERLVVLTNPALISGTDTASTELAELMVARAQDESTTTITFSPAPLRILPQPKALVDFKKQIDIGFATRGAELDDTLTTANPAIDYLAEFDGRDI